MESVGETTPQGAQIEEFTELQRLLKQEKEKHQVLEESSKLEHADADRTEGASSLQRRTRKTRPTPRSAGRKTTQHKRSPCQIIPHCQS